MNSVILSKDARENQQARFWPAGSRVRVEGPFLFRRLLCALLMTLLAVPPLPAQQSQQGKLPAQQLYRFKANTEVVLVNVIVRDKNGNPIRNLKKDDFTLLEDNKPQAIQ